jgi:hypothetical protein
VSRAPANPIRNSAAKAAADTAANPIVRRERKAEASQRNESWRNGLGS